MSIYNKINNLFTANKSFSSNIEPIFARLNDGNSSYNYEVERAGLLEFLRGGNSYFTPLNDYKSYYFKVSYLADVIDFISNIIVQAEIFEVKNNNNNIVEDSEFIKLLDSPNPYQTRQEFIKEALINYYTSGVSIVYSNFFNNGNLRAYNNTLYNVHYNTLKFPVVKNPYSLKSKELNDFDIKQNLGGGERIFKFSELAFAYDIGKYSGFADDGYKGEKFLAPISRLSSLKLPLQTILNVQDSIAYLTDNPVLGILSKKAKEGGLMPLNGQEKNDIEKKINGKGQYGTSVRGKGGIIVSSDEHNYNSILPNVKQMMLIEMENDAKENINSRFNISRDLKDATSGVTKGSTYENKQVAEALFINGFCKRDLDNILTALMQRSKAYFDGRDTRLVSSFDHFPSIQAFNAESLFTGLDLKMDALTKAQNAYKTYVELNPNGLSYDEFMIANGFDDLLTHKK